MITRVLVLGAIGLTVAGVASTAFLWSGGSPRLLGLSVDMHWAVTGSGTVRRVVTVSGFPPVARVVAAGLDLDADHGWVEQISEADNPEEPNGLVFVRKTAWDDQSWTLVRVVEWRRDGGIFRQHCVYREQFMPDLVNRRRVTEAARTAPFEVDLDGSARSLWKELKAALAESGQRTRVAIDDFIAAIPAQLRVELPGRIVEIDGIPMTESSDGSHQYRGTLGDLALSGEFVVRSTRYAPTGFMAMGAASILAGGVVVVVGRERGRRQRNRRRITEMKRRRGGRRSGSRR